MFPYKKKGIQKRVFKIGGLKSRQKKLVFAIAKSEARSQASDKG